MGRFLPQNENHAAATWKKKKCKGWCLELLNVIGSLAEHGIATSYAPLLGHLLPPASRCVPAAVSSGSDTATLSHPVEGTQADIFQ